MLIYHFGSREGMLEAVVNELANRGRARDEELFSHDGHDGLRAKWERIQAKDNRDAERLFFELAAIAVRRPSATERFSREYAEPWLEISARSVAEMPVDPAQARVVPRLDIAVLRGLLLDLLVTGDADEVDAAFDAYSRLRRELIDRAIQTAVDHA